MAMQYVKGVPQAHACACHARHDASGAWGHGVPVHGRSWVEATMAPEGQDYVTGQAYVVCNRNGLDIQPYSVASGSVPSSILRSIVSALHRRQ
jgi:hypothetical protein